MADSSYYNEYQAGKGDVCKAANMLSKITYGRGFLCAVSIIFIVDKTEFTSPSDNKRSPPLAAGNAPKRTQSWTGAMIDTNSVNKGTVQVIVALRDDALN